MNDLAQTGLREPEQVDWDNAFKGSTYSAPPPAFDASGKPIVYYGQVVEAREADKNDDGYLQYQVDLKIVKSGQYDGTKLRTWISTRPFMKRNVAGELEPIKGNPNSMAKFLRSAGLQAKPQSNSEYVASIKAVNGKALGFTIDWEAKNRDTGEVVRGYACFPDNTEFPGTKKSILKAGDVVTERDKKGNVTGTRAISSEIMFANARLKYFQDATPKPTARV